MSFNSTEYGLFLAAVFIAWWALSESKARGLRTWFLLGASYFFYSRWNASYLLLILAVTLLDFVSGLMIERSRSRGKPGVAKAWLVLAAGGGLLALAVFKYFGFFTGSVSEALSWMGASWTEPAVRFVLPVGISFYTFQGLSYVIDVYRGHTAATRSLKDFALYISFFPQLVAGPIVRSDNLLPQFARGPDRDWEKIGSGLFQVLCGLFKKIVIADVLAEAYVDRAFSDPSRVGLPLAWLAMYGYALQIYCDFSGYTDIAIGSARILGLNIPVNFNRPYLAANLRDFWRRWHISLSTWLRDYLYISLGGNKKGRARMLLALMVTMTLGGLWHGAAWTFLIWGAYHGVLLAVTRLWQEKRGQDKDDAGKAAIFISRLVTFHLVCIGWIVFRCGSMEKAAVMVSKLATGPLTSVGTPGAKVLAVLIFGYFLHFSSPELKEKMKTAFTGLPPSAQGAILALALALFSLLSSASSPFIYFQF